MQIIAALPNLSPVGGLSRLIAVRQARAPLNIQSALCSGFGEENFSRLCPLFRNQSSWPHGILPGMASFPLSKQGGGPALGCTLGFGTPFSAQLMARVGYDWALIDMEHNPLSAREAGLMTHVIVSASAGKCRPIIRVPSHGVEWIKWALDCGSHGILVPMVKSGAEAEELVQRAVYPPRGQRSFGPSVAVFADLDSAATAMKYRTQTSKTVALIPMIESVEGLDNAEAICSVDGVTAVFIGPVDLRFSMGLTGGDGNEEAYLAALKKIVTICKRLNKPVGTFAVGEEECRKRTEEGFNFLLVCHFLVIRALYYTTDFYQLPGETVVLVAGAKASLADAMKGIKGAKL